MEQEVPLYMHFDALFVFHLSVSACHTNVSEFRMAGEVVISLVQFPFFKHGFLRQKLDEPKTEKKTPLFIKENFKFLKYNWRVPSGYSCGLSSPVQPEKRESYIKSTLL